MEIKKSKVKMLSEKLTKVFIITVMLLCVLTLSSMAEIDFSAFSMCASAVEEGETFTEGFYTYEVIELYENVSQAEARGEVMVKNVDKAIDFFQEMPAYVNGYKITKIAAYAFEDCYNLYGITVPDTVETIGIKAFYDCKNLSRIELPDTITYIGSDAFSGTEYVRTQDSGARYVGKYLIDYFSGDTEANGVEVKDGTILIAEDVFYKNINYLKLPSSLKYFYSQGKDFKVSDIYLENVETWLNLEFGELGYSEGILYGVENMFVNSSPLTELVIPGTVSEIKNNAFKGYKNLKSLTIPGTVKTIGESAFMDCTNLKTVKIENGVELLFDDCFSYAGITGITIPGSVKTVKGFGYCASLEKVVLGEGIENIESRAFSNCGNLSEITVPKSLKASDSSAFMMCQKLKKVNISDVGAWIDIDFGLSERQFDYDASSNPLCYDADLYLNGKIVKELVIPRGATKIKEAAFAGCNSINKVVIPEGVTEIGAGAFCYTKNLEEIVWASTVNKVETEAFYRSGGSVYITDLSAWLNVDYCDGEYTDYSDTLYTSNPATELYLNGEEVVNLVIPDGLAGIKQAVFARCDSIKTVVIPEGVKVVGKDAFRDCDELEAVILPKSLERIEKNAFRYAKKIKVYYRGNIPEWDLVQVAPSAGIEKPDVINYTEDHIHSCDITESVKATYSSEGKDVYTCKYCDYTYTETSEMLPLETVSGLKVKKTTASSITLSWKKVEGAEGYNVMYSTNGKKWKSVKVTKNSVTVKKLTAAKTYRFKVTAMAGTNIGEECEIIKGTTKFTTATISKVTSSNKNTAVVTWKKVTNASGYVIEYSTSKKFTKKTTKTVTIKKGKTTKTTLKKLKSGKKYYVRIKAYKTINKKSVYSSYSNVKTVKIK